MARSKHAPALFDVLGNEAGKTTDAAKLHGWWRHDKPKPTPSVEPTRSEPVSTPVDVRVEDAVPTESATSSEGLISVEGDRVRVSLTSVSGAVVVFVAAAMMLGVYGLGQRSGEQSGYRAGRASFEAQALTDIELARQQPPATYVLGGLATGDVSAPVQVETQASGEAEQAPVWIRGYSYVVVQEFTSSRTDDVPAVQGFLTQRGVDTEPIATASGGVQLVTRQGFNLRDETQKQLADGFLNRIHLLGKEFFDGGGRYRLQGYLRTLTRDAW